MKKIRVGVIGTGVMGGFHVRQYKNIPDAELIGIYDNDKDRAVEAAKKYETRAFNNYRELFPLVDAISIATPTSTHYSVGMTCLDSGKHVLIEKPITLDPHEAENMIKKAKANGLVLAVGHIERFNPAYKKFRDLLNEGGIGSINIIDAKRFSPYPERISDMSVVMDVMIHDIDLALDLARSDVVKINAKGETIKSKSLDKAIANITFKNGIIANLEADRLYPTKVRQLIVSSNDVVYDMDLIKKELVIKQANKTEQADVVSYDQLQFELADFIGSIVEGRKPLVSGEEGLKVLAVAKKIEELALSGA